MNQIHKPDLSNGHKLTNGSAKIHSAAIRVQKRNQDDANHIVSQYANASQKRQQARTNTATDVFDKLKITFLGGLEDVGEKNMAIIEYQNDAIVLDCGLNLSIDLPGVNYSINDTSYLESIKHKLKAYVLTHGHLDHIGGLKHTVPLCPAPIYGSRYTIGLVEKAFEDLYAETGLEFKPQLVTGKLDTHERLRVGSFYVEFIRVTHSLPDAAAVCIDTPIGRIIATGDFRLDPEPLDRMPTDTKRLQELGEQGVLLLLSESSYSDAEGRVPTESTLQQSFYDIIGKAEGRIFVAAFSSNMNRTQMIINAAVATGRKIALDGRGMLSYSEIAVRQGILKVPKGSIVPIGQSGTIPANQLLVMCTGGQGEPNAALQRMSEGQHKFVNLDAGDTVVISSSAIPGNEVNYNMISNQLKKKGVHLFRHPTHEIDGCGPLHVSGHAKREELREMIRFTRPKFFIPVHGGYLRRYYHAELGIEEGIPRKNVLLPENGDSLLFTANAFASVGPVPHGSLLIDQTSSIVSGLVVKDRLILSEEGILAVVLTIDKKSGQLLTSPDVISRGFISMRDSEKLMEEFRSELRRVVRQRFNRVDLDRFKSELKEHVTHFLFEQTERVPIVIPIVNLVTVSTGSSKATIQQTESKNSRLANDQKRFAEMRARLLSQDQRD